MPHVKQPQLSIFKNWYNSEVATPAALELYALLRVFLSTSRYADSMYIKNYESVTFSNEELKIPQHYIQFLNHLHSMYNFTGDEIIPTTICQVISKLLKGGSQMLNTQYSKRFYELTTPLVHEGRLIEVLLHDECLQKGLVTYIVAKTTQFILLNNLLILAAAYKKKGLFNLCIQNGADDFSMVYKAAALSFNHQLKYFINRAVLNAPSSVYVDTADYKFYYNSMASIEEECKYYHSETTCDTLTRIFDKLLGFKHSCVCEAIDTNNLLVPMSMWTQSNIFFYMTYMSREHVHRAGLYSKYWWTDRHDNLDVGSIEFVCV